MDREVESLWDIAAGRRSSLESPLDDLLQDLAADSEWRAAANMEGVTTLREVLRSTPATVDPGSPVGLPALVAVLLAKLLLGRFR
jgi:hypothetical protein